METWVVDYGQGAIAKDLTAMSFGSSHMVTLIFSAPKTAASFNDTSPLMKTLFALLSRLITSALSPL